VLVLIAVASGLGAGAVGAIPPVGFAPCAARAALNPCVGDTGGVSFSFSFIFFICPGGAPRGWPARAAGFSGLEGVGASVGVVGNLGVVIVVLGNVLGLRGSGQSVGVYPRGSSMKSWSCTRMPLMPVPMILPFSMI
jgi:hypothetical protein